MIQSVADAESWLEAKGGTWTRIRVANGWEVIAWVGPFSRRLPVEDGTIESTLVDTVNQLVKEPVFS